MGRAQLIREADFGRPDVGDGVVEDVEVVFVSAIAIRGVVVIVDGHAHPGYLAVFLNGPDHRIDDANSMSIMGWPRKASCSLIIDAPPHCD